MALFEIDHTSDIPAWVQLRHRLIYLINTGHYLAGDQLPTVRSLAAEVSLNYNTVSKTYASLERDGYINCSRRGAFVNEPSEGQGETGPTVALAEEFVRACLEEGLSFDDIRKQMNKVIKQIQKERETAAASQPSKEAR